MYPNIHDAVQGMSRTLGMSPEHVIERCSIRELLLWLAMAAQTAEMEEQMMSEPESLEDEVDRFRAEVL